jgi:hypothetical protein
MSTININILKTHLHWHMQMHVGKHPYKFDLYIQEMREFTAFLSCAV